MLGRYLRGVAGELDLLEGRRWLERSVTQGVPESETDFVELP